MDEYLTEKAEQLNALSTVEIDALNKILALMGDLIIIIK